MRNAQKVLVRKSAEKRPLGRPKHRWKDNIKMIIEKQGEKLWMGLIWFRTLTALTLWISKSADKFLTSFMSTSISRSNLLYESGWLVSKGKC
jgi:hypothetical protein